MARTLTNLGPLGIGKSVIPFNKITTIRPVVRGGDSSMSEAASGIVIELAKGLIEFARRTDPTWRKVFYRFQWDGSSRTSHGSYVSDSSTTLIDAITYGDFYSSMRAKATELAKLLGKDQGVFLLVADATFNFNIFFEFKDPKRWKITMLDGGTGIPEGYTSRDDAVRREDAL